MSTAVIENLRQERDSARDAAIAMAEQEGFDPTDEAYGHLEERAAKLDGQIEQLAKLIEARQAADALDGKMSKATKRQEERSSEAPETRESLGQLFTRSAMFTDYRGRGQSGIFETELQTRALPTGIADLIAAGMKGASTSVDTTAPTAPTPLLDNLNQVQVSGNAVEFVTWGLKAGAAAVVAEKAPKPSVEFGPTVTSDTLDTIAAYTKLTRQLLEDFTAVQSLIDGELRREVAREEEAQAAAAFAGASLPSATGDDLLSAIRVGMGTVMAAGYSPTAVMLNPADWADLDIAVFNASASGPTAGQSFWGLRPIANNDQAAGTAVVGDFRSAATRFFRSNIAVYISDSVGDDFLSNVFTLLCERRSLSAVVRPQALCECAG